MLHFYKFSADVPAPVPARESYEPRKPGKGWPEHCPPVRAANSFGWDVLAPFEMRFRKERGKWRLQNPRDLESDWVYEPAQPDGAASSAGGAPLIQRNAWFWERRQKLPHEISANAYKEIRNQVKVSTYLFLFSDPNELLYVCDIPNRKRPYRAVSVLLETDWYPASYPWHCVLELDPGQKVIRIQKGEPLCRLFLVRRENYFAQELSTPEFERHFERGQDWLARYGRGKDHDMKDITGTYVKQQRKSSFSVIL